MTTKKSCNYFKSLGGQDRCGCDQQSDVFTFEVSGKDVPMYQVNNPLDSRLIPVRRGDEIKWYQPLALVNYLRVTFGAEIPPDSSTIIIPFDLVDACTQKIVGSFISIPINGEPFVCACPEEEQKINFTFDVWDYFTLGPCKELLFQAVPSESSQVQGSTEMRARIADVNAPVVNVCTQTVERQVYDHHNSILSTLIAAKGFSRSCGLPTYNNVPSEKTMVLRVNGNINATGFIQAPTPLQWRLTFDGIEKCPSVNTIVISIAVVNAELECANMAGISTNANSAEPACVYTTITRVYANFAPLISVSMGGINTNAKIAAQDDVNIIAVNTAVDSAELEYANMANSNIIARSARRSSFRSK